MSLTDVLIRSLKPESRPYKRADAGGLYLEVRPTGAKLWRFAYVNARYSPHYKISAEELSWIGERVADLEGLVEKICRDHIAALGSADRAAE